MPFSAGVRERQVPDDISFVWPTSGVMHVTSVPGGGCNIKFTFADRGMVRSIGKGRILTTRKIATKRIAEQYEIIIRHDGDFESNYSIIDQTPHSTAENARRLRALGTLVDSGSELYDIQNGGTLHFQLFRAGKLVDPRLYLREP
jgi:hypothetical protein